MKESFLMTRGILYGRQRFLMTRANHEKELAFRKAVLVNKLRLHKPKAGQPWRSFRAEKAARTARFKVFRHPKYVAQSPNFRFHLGRVKRS